MKKRVDLELEGLIGLEFHNVFDSALIEALIEIAGEKFEEVTVIKNEVHVPSENWRNRVNKYFKKEGYVYSGLSEVQFKSTGISPAFEFCSEVVVNGMHLSCGVLDIIINTYLALKDYFKSKRKDSLVLKYPNLAFKHDIYFFLDVLCEKLNLNRTQFVISPSFS